MFKLQAKADKLEQEHKQAVEIKTCAPTDPYIGLYVIGGIGLAIELLFLFYCIKRMKKSSKADDVEEAN